MPCVYKEIFRALPIAGNSTVGAGTVDECCRTFISVRNSTTAVKNTKSGIYLSPQERKQRAIFETGSKSKVMSSGLQSNTGCDENGQSARLYSVLPAMVMIVRFPILFRGIPGTWRQVPLLKDCRFTARISTHGLSRRDGSEYFVGQPC